MLLNNSGFYSGCFTKWCLHNSTNLSYYNDAVSKLLSYEVKAYLYKVIHLWSTWFLCILWFVRIFKCAIFSAPKIRKKSAKSTRPIPIDFLCIFVHIQSCWWQLLATLFTFAEENLRWGQLRTPGFPDSLQAPLQCREGFDLMRSIVCGWTPTHTLWLSIFNLFFKIVPG